LERLRAMKSAAVLGDDSKCRISSLRQWKMRWRSPAVCSWLIAASSDRLPALAFAQRSDVCDVVFAMPRVEREVLIDRHCAEFGMEELALHIVFRQRSQENRPSLV